MNDRILKYRVSLIKAPLDQPFRTALGEHAMMENVLFAIELADGTKGLGEAAIATHITGETIEQTVKNLNKAGRYLIGKSVNNCLDISIVLHEQFSNNKSVVAAVETSLFDALTRQKKIPLWKFFGSKPKKFQSDITIVIADLKETSESAAKFYSQGFRTFKVKIGRDLDLDLKRVLAVKKNTKNSPIILDANQGYSAKETLGFLRKIKKAGVRPVLVEQPVRKNDWEGLKKVTRESGVLVCADESVCSTADALRVIKEKAAGAINIKLMKTGIVRSLEIALLAHGAGLKLMIGGMMESSLAMTASAHLAAGLGCFDFVDLDTPFFIKKGFDRNPYLNSRGVYDLSTVKGGIGIQPRVNDPGSETRGC